MIRSNQSLHTYFLNLSSYPPSLPSLRTPSLSQLYIDIVVLTKQIVFPIHYIYFLSKKAPIIYLSVTLKIILSIVLVKTKEQSKRMKSNLQVVKMENFMDGLQTLGTNPMEHLSSVAKCLCA